VYLGTPAVAVPPLLALDDAGFDIALVVSRPDKRRGRGSKLSPSPVKQAARERGIPVTDAIEDALTVDADLGVVVAYGRLIATPILAALPMVNIHFSLLPRWRGAAPVERAILAGDATTGVGLMALAPELDTGDIYAQRELAIGDNDTLDQLRAALVTLGSTMLVEELGAGLGPPRPQIGEPTYAAKLTTEDHRLDFTHPAAELHRVVRLGRAWTMFRDKRLKVVAAEPVACPSSHPGAADEANTLAGTTVVAANPGELSGAVVHTGHGCLHLHQVQPEGKRVMEAAAWLNGIQPQPGERLG